MTIDWPQITVLVSTALGSGGLGAFLSFRSNKNRDNRSADAQLITTNLKLVDALLGRIDALEKAAVSQDADCDRKLDALRTEVNKCQIEITTLTIKLAKYERANG